MGYSNPSRVSFTNLIITESADFLSFHHTPFCRNPTRPKYAHFLASLPLTLLQKSTRQIYAEFQPLLFCKKKCAKNYADRKEKKSAKKKPRKICSFFLTENHRKSAKKSGFISVQTPPMLWRRVFAVKVSKLKYHAVFNSPSLFLGVKKVQ